MPHASRPWSFLAGGGAAVMLALLGIEPAGVSVPSLADHETQTGASPGRPPSPPPAPPLDRFALTNRFAYIPPQCFTKTRGDGHGPASNPCYACHVRSAPPNHVDDADLQLTLSLPAAAASNPWTNLFDPPVARGPRVADDDVLAYVRRSNYVVDEVGSAPAPAASPSTITREWSGFRPDAWFAFDERGFDHRPDGTFTGWRAFAYYPFLGTFFPTNGSIDDVLIRLDPVLQQDAEGRFDPAIYAANLAIVETLVTRRDVPRALHFVGRAATRRLDGERLGFQAIPGLLPLNTEFLHSVRYLDVAPDGAVRMAARMKELRYAKKVRWLSDAELARLVARENAEQSASPDGISYFVPQGDRGVYNGQGWLFQGFIEATDGALRPQSYEETVACVGCHGGIGATTDSIFSLPRKLPPSSAAHGWFHWSQHGLAGTPEPRRRDGRYEYSLYLEMNRAGDELRENTEVLDRFFDGAGRLRPVEIARLHTDIGTLLLPSPARAIDLDRAYMAIVRDQGFVRGRDAVLGPAANVHERAPVGDKTGIERAIEGR